MTEVLPWDHVNVKKGREYLEKEQNRSVVQLAGDGGGDVARSSHVGRVRIAFAAEFGGPPQLQAPNRTLTSSTEGSKPRL